MRHLMLVLLVGGSVLLTGCFLTQTKVVLEGDGNQLFFNAPVKEDVTGTVQGSAGGGSTGAADVGANQEAAAWTPTLNGIATVENASGTLKLDGKAGSDLAPVADEGYKVF